jgi:hypothetical protein
MACPFTPKVLAAAWTPPTNTNTHIHIGFCRNHFWYRAYQHGYPRRYDFSPLPGGFRIKRDLKK